ncbi:hypothetical protein PanWU01x14_233390 [Parasponia andersonii]|uniref:Uncharacterized protein n=1 Tax=Parasponia andersonii TaxID=3476 RepID=A0A2P5BJH5_PARAD|nr:hypothetical protein PanWU01x14_233390 [Parasponia andersonii]
MGQCFSSRSIPSSINQPEFSSVRLVHLNGYVEDFEPPVSVSYVVEKPSKQFVCTAAQLLSTGFKPFRPETLLEPGRIYFLLPYSVIQAEVSPLDLASLAKRLTAAAAKTGRSSSYRSSGRASPSSSQHGCPSPVWSSPARSPNRFSEPDQMGDLATFGAQRSARARSWKPNLDPIREKSFNRRSESELQFEASKRFEV